MWDFLLQLAIGALVGAAVGVIILNLQSIYEWVNSSINSESAELVLVRALNEGNYNVVAGVFNRQQTLTAQKEWSNVTMEQELEELFAGHESVRIVLNT